MASKTVEDFIVDFSKEEEGGGGGAHFKPATYLMRIAGAKTGVSENKNTPYLEVIFVFKEGQYAKAKKKLEERLYITPKAIRRFRILLQAVDVKVPAKLNVVKLIPKLKGKELYVQIEDKPPQEEGGRVRSQAAFEGFINVEDYDPDDEDVEDEDLEEEDEDLEDDDDLEDEDEDEDDEEEEEEEPAPRRRKKAPAKKPASKKRKRPEPEEEEDEDEDDEDDEEEEEEPPRRRKSSKASKAKPKAKKPRRKRDEEDEDDEDEDDLDDLNLDDM